MTPSRSTTALAAILAGLSLQGSIQAATFFDNFDGYVAGSDVHGQGGWKGWDNTPAAGALVSNAFSNSAPNSLDISGGSDLVHTFTGATSGQWTLSMLQYIPSTSTGDSFLVLLNTYSDGGPYNWSLQTHFNMETGLVIADFGTPASLSIITDQWVPFRAEIDLDADTVSEFYNNQLLGVTVAQCSGKFKN